MDRKDGILLIIGVALEPIGWGVGMITNIPSQVGYAAIALGFLMVCYAGIRFIGYKPVYSTWREAKARGEARKYYLFPLKDNINKTINLYNKYVKTAGNLSLARYDDKYYRTKYDRDSDKYKRKVISKMEGKLFIAFFTIPSGLSFVSNNPYYAKLKRKMPKDLVAEYNEAFSHIVDKRLSKYLKQLWNLEQKHNSINIFYELWRDNLKEKPITSNYINKQQGKLKEAFNEKLQEVNTRIDELLGGVPDEQ